MAKEQTKEKEVEVTPENEEVDICVGGDCGDMDHEYIEPELSHVLGFEVLINGEVVNLAVNDAFSLLQSLTGLLEECQSLAPGRTCTDFPQNDHPQEEVIEAMELVEKTHLLNTRLEEMLDEANVEIALLREELRESSNEILKPIPPKKGSRNIRPKKRR